MADTVKVHAIMFASLREAAGRPILEVDLPLGSTVANLVTALQERLPPLRERLRFARVAVNESLAGLATVLRAGDEVAFLPPVSGG